MTFQHFLLLWLALSTLPFTDSHLTEVVRSVYDRPEASLDTSIFKCYQTFQLGGCPKVQPMKALNLTGIFGKWHIVAHYSDYRFEGKRCISRVFSNAGGNDGDNCRVNVTHGSTNIVTGERTSHHSWIVSPDEDNKDYLVLAPADGLPMKFYPIATNYHTFLATHLCEQFPQDCPVVHRQHNAIMMRGHDFSDQDYQKSLEALAEFGIDIAPFQLIDNENCKI